MLNLGVNIDHIATVREARKATLPSPLAGALAAEQAGAWGITAHLREDRRHIHDSDIFELKDKVRRLNMEMAITDDMVQIASRVVPHSCCLVPEKREELTTEGGLCVSRQIDKTRDAVRELKSHHIVVSLFVDPDFKELDAAAEVGADYVELHTGAYSNCAGTQQLHELERLKAGADYADKLGLKVNAGHGIDYWNIKGILEVRHLNELNIGHCIVARAIICGMEQAVREMLEAMKPYRF